MSLDGAKSLLFRHFEKLTAAGIIAVIAAYLLSIAVGSSEAAQLRMQTEDALGRIEESKQNPEEPEPVNVNFLQQVREGFLDVRAAGPEPAWFAYKRPFVLRRAFFRVPFQALHFAPALTARADVGEAGLVWQDSPRNENVEVRGYELYRRKGNGSWRLLARIPAGTLSYTDRGLEHEQEYSYKLLSVAAPAEGAAPFADPADAKKETEPRNVLTLFNFDLRINSWVPGRIGGKLIIRGPGGGTEERSFSWRKGSRVVIDNRDSGWVVDKIEENSVILKKGNREKTFSK
jgi:hypothetical protein